MILLYHKIDLLEKTRWYVSADSFNRQMAELQYKKVVHLDEYDPANDDHVAITFDGVYDGVWRYAARILEKWKYPYDLFVIGDHIGGDNTFDRGEPLERFATLDMLTEMADRGGRIQWHSASHRRLEEIHDENELRREIEIPHRLRSKFDYPHFCFFAYPYDLNPEHRADTLVRRNFKGALACERGVSGDRYRLNRITVTEETRLGRSSISVIIPNYNYGAYLPEAIDSVLRQTRKPDEILIIDDCSTDDSVEILNSYQEQVKIVINEVNLGIVENFKKAVDLTNGDYIAFLGADNRMRSDYVERVMATLDANADAAVAYTDLIVFGPLAAALAQGVGAQPIEFAGIYYWQFPEPTPDIVAAIRTDNFIHGSSAYRRSWYAKVGGYEASEAEEDRHLFARMLEAGGKAVHVPQALIEYRQHSPAQANTVFGMQIELAELRRQVKRLRQIVGETTAERVSLPLYAKQTSASEVLDRGIYSVRQFLPLLTEDQDVAVRAAIQAFCRANDLKSSIALKRLPRSGTLDFRGVGNGLPFIELGIGSPGPEGTWVIEAQATLRLPLEFGIGRFFRGKLRYMPFTSEAPPKALNWRIVVNEHWTEPIRLAPAAIFLQSYEFEISAAVLGEADEIRLDLCFDDAAISPAALGISPDERPLRMLLSDFRYEYE